MRILVLWRLYMYFLFFRLRGLRLLIIDYLTAPLLFSRVSVRKSTHQRTNDDNDDGNDDDDGGSVLRNISKNTSVEDTGGDCPG